VPAWAIVIVTSATTVTALSVLIRQVIKPGAKAITLIEELIPPAKVIAKEFSDNPEALSVVYDMSQQFKSDSGSTLKDAMNRQELMLETAAKTLDALGKTVALLTEGAERLRVAEEVRRQMDERDREQMQKLFLTVDRLGIKLEGDRRHLAEDLAVSKTVIEGVASDLAASHAEADKLMHASSQAGEAADAAARTPVGESDAP